MSANIGDASLAVSATPIAPMFQTPFSGQVATFSDAGFAANPSADEPYTATIDYDAEGRRKGHTL